MKNSWIISIIFILFYGMSFTQDYLKHVSATIPACHYGDYVLTFEDNFDGNSLDLDTWELKPWEQGGKYHINTLEPDNIEVSSGTLKIKLDNQVKVRLHDANQPPGALIDGQPNLRSFPYSSSEIWTKKSDFRYGKYEIRAKIDACEGIWPAFWTYSGDGDTPGGSRWNELDIFEIYHEKEFGVNKWDFTSTLHYDYYNDGDHEKKEFIDEVHNNFDQWHTYTCYFTETKISIYIDNVLVDEILKYKNTDCESQDTFYGNLKELFAWPREMGSLILNMAVDRLNPQNGKGDISDNPSSAFPCTYEIDYVRYWQQSNCITNNVIPQLFYGAPVIWGPLNTGLDISILDEARLVSGLNTTVVAANSIISLGDFEVELGANFDAWIDPNSCVLYKSNETTGINDNQLQEALDKENIGTFKEQIYNSIFPNPTNSSLNISLDDAFLGGEVHVYDIMGKLMYQAKLTDAYSTLHCFAEFPVGIYQVILQNGNLREVQKVMKE